MAKFYFIFSISFFLLTLQIRAQIPPPCPNPPPPGAESCGAACVYCNFDGYSGINNGTPSGGPLVCGQITLHNDQWFGFIAGSTSITIDVSTSNCLQGNGLQSAFFDACTNDALACNVGVAGGEGQPLLVSYGNFVPGQVYYFMIDGYTGDVCDFSIGVVDGSIEPPPVTEVGPIDGVTDVCPGATLVYTIPPSENASTYIWTAPPGSSINGQGSTVTIPANAGGTSVTITFGQSPGQVCVSARNQCTSPIQTCLPINNMTPPPTILPPLTLCFEDLPFIWTEQPYNQLIVPGTFNLSTIPPYDNWLGCDSIIRQTIIVRQKVLKNLPPVFLCEGDCFSINGNSYCQAGVFEEVFDNGSFLGCDSTVRFTVTVIPVKATIPQPPPISCANPSLTLTSTGSIGAGIIYNWTNSNWTSIGNQSTQVVTTPGIYHLIVTANQGGVMCKDTATVNVTSDGQIPTAAATGGAINCLPNFSSTTLMGSTNLSGMGFQWNGPGINVTNQFLQNPTVSQPGTYVLTVTNPANGCSATATATVTADLVPPTATAVGTNLTCLQTNTVLTTTTNISNGNFNWSGPGINGGNQNQQNPTVSQPGNYVVTVTNPTNGCTATATVDITQNIVPPTVSAGSDHTLTCIAPDATLNASTTGGAIVWTGPGITPVNQTQPNPTVNLAGTYIITVTNTANGCAKADTTIVTSIIQNPTVAAGADQTINCKNPSVVLNGNGSSQGNNFTATWTGPGINGGNQNQYEPAVNQPGTYTLTIVNQTNGCTGTDVVVVDENVAVPTASAGTDLFLTCVSAANGVALQGNGTPGGVTYLWTGPGIGANNETQQQPVVTAAGTYNLTVTNPVNGCTATDEAIVTTDANVPVATGGADQILNCTVKSVNFDGTGSTTGASVTYSWTGPNTFTSSDLSPQNITAPGTYTLTVLNTTNNCKNTDVVVVLEDIAPPTLAMGQNQILNCYNNGADTISAVYSASGAAYTIQWSGPAITPANATDSLPVVNQPGIYNLLITNTENTCTSTGQLSVTADLTAPAALAGPDKIIDCVVTSTSIGGNSSTGANFIYHWTGPAVQPQDTSSKTPTVKVPGTYTLLVTNTTNGCTSTDDVEVTLNAVYPVANAGLTDTLTCLQPNVTIGGSGTSGGAGITVQWSGPGISPANQGQPQPNVAAPGTYILTVTNTTNSCITKDTVVIDEDKVLPTAAAGLDKKLDCKTTSVVLDGGQSSSGQGISYLWTGPGITPANETDKAPSIDAPGTYTILVSNAENGCTQTDAVVVTQDIAPPTANAGANVTLTCAQNTDQLDGSGSSSGVNFSFAWDGPGINSFNFNLQNPTVADSGTYTLQVTNIQNNCTATDLVYVALDGQFPAVDAGPEKTLTCALDTLQLDGSLSATGAGITYAWSGPGLVAGQSGQLNPSIFQPGIYTLTVTNTTNGCSKTDVVNVLQNIIEPLVEANSDLTLTCSANNVNLNSTGSSTGSGFQITWQGPGIDATNEHLPSPSVSSAGVYTLIITDLGNGCSNSDKMEVKLDQGIPTVSAGPDLIITCTTPTVKLLGTASSSSSGFLSFNWSGPGINPANKDEEQPTVSIGGTYNLTVTNATTQCSATDVVIVTEDNLPPDLTMTADTLSCAQPQSRVEATSSVPGVTYKWQGPGIGNNQTNSFITVNQAGLFTLVITAPNGCTTQKTIEVFQDADFPVGTAEGTTLNCINNGQSAINATIGTAGATGAWTGPGGFTSTDLSVNVSAGGNYVFTITSPNGCKKTIPVTVSTDFAKPAIKTAVPEMIDCNTPAVTLDATGSATGSNFSYLWTGPGIASGETTLTPSVNEEGTYNLLITNSSNGCTSETDVLVQIDPAVPTGINLNLTNVKCFDDENGEIEVVSVVGGTQPFVYSLNGGVASATKKFTGLKPGTYILDLEDANGCKAQETVEITAPEELVVGLGPDVKLELGDSTLVQATIAGGVGGETITWKPAVPCDTTCLEFYLTPSATGVYEITVVDSNGCPARDEIQILLVKNRNIYVPNVFDPESTTNDFLMIQANNKAIKNVKKWLIFDRWGEAVFEVSNFLPNDPNYAWRGKMRKDKQGHSDVYVWYAEIEFIDGVTETYKGDVLLVYRK